MTQLFSALECLGRAVVACRGSHTIRRTDRHRHSRPMRGDVRDVVTILLDKYRSSQQYQLQLRIQTRYARDFEWPSMIQHADDSALECPCNAAIFTYITDSIPAKISFTYCRCGWCSTVYSRYSCAFLSIYSMIKTQS